jgi:transposase
MQETRAKPHHKRHQCEKDVEIASLKQELKVTKTALARLEERFCAFEKAQKNIQKRQQERIWKLELEIKEKDQQIDALKKTNAYLMTELFGRKSEIKAIATKTKPENKAAKNKKKRGQQPGSTGHGRSVRGVTNKTEKPVLVTETRCECCQKEYLILEATKDSKLIEFYQTVEEITYQRQVAVSQCLCLGKVIRVAELPCKLFPRTDIGNTLWTHFLVSKYLFGMPTNRLKKALSLQGIDLPLGTLTAGFKHINDKLTVLYEAIKGHCRGGDLWNADETSWRVMDAEKKRFWLWVVASDDAVVYLLDQSRSAKVPVEFFQSSIGTLITDRYSAYKKLGEQIQKAWCWVHVRRDFLAVFKGVKKHHGWAKKWLLRITKLFLAQHKRMKLLENNSNSQEDWDTANQHLVKLLETFDGECRKEISLNKLDKLQSKILRSLRRHWKGLTIFATDPRIPMDNNRAERLLRTCVVLRKNSYGSGTDWSGQLAAKLFTLFHTWQINGLNPDKLLLAFLNDCSPLNAQLDLNKYLPWMMTVARKREFELPSSITRPA